MNKKKQKQNKANEIIEENGSDEIFYFFCYKRNCLILIQQFF